MKKLICLGLYVVLFTFNALAITNQENPEKTYSISIIKKNQLFVIGSIVKDSKSLRMSATAAEIIYELMDKEEYEHDVDLSGYYLLEVYSEIPLKDIREQILEDFLGELGLKLTHRQIEVDALRVSWREGVDECDESTKSKNSEAKIHISLTNRNYISGHSLEKFCDAMNSKLETTLLIPGEMDIYSLPGLWINKRKITKSPASYLQKKGFEVEETIAIIEIPFVTSTITPY